MQAPYRQNVNAYGGGNVPPGAVVIQTVGPVVYRPQQPRSRPAVLPYRNAHMVFGIIQMVVGGLCFLLDVAAVSLITDYQRFGAGIYSGIFFFIAGLLGYLAGRLNSTCCVVACMVMNIIASCVAVIGLSFASIEIGSYYYYYDSQYSGYIHNKAIFVLCACIFEFIFTIVHSSLTCASCCYCCLPRQPVPEPGQVGTTTTVHQQIQPQAQQLYPGQQQMYYPQHMQAQQMPAQTMPPGYPYNTQPIAYPQQGDGNYPYNPAFGPESSGSANPPPYNEAVTGKGADKA